MKRRFTSSIQREVTQKKISPQILTSFFTLTNSNILPDELEDEVVSAFYIRQWHKQDGQFITSGDHRL